MIDPSKVTNYERTGKELEEFLLFAIVAAGKPAYQQAEKLDQFLIDGVMPFKWIRMIDDVGTLDFHLRYVKMGQYNRIASAFRGVADFFRYDSDNVRFHPLATVPDGWGIRVMRFLRLHLVVRSIWTLKSFSLTMLMIWV